MFEITREIVAYGIIGGIVVLGAPFVVATLRKRHRDKLRRRGIKRYGH
ncbi:hypothetical protein ACLN6N_14915 [Sphingomonas carotinifaciens]|uniref:Uncharacterized protein n=1 Tax=Sphingomonas carotinifaciens TaxID=1166323 RepID=A0A1G7FDK8_9SPHN|nr:MULTISPECIES: hypothetical protein [Sphingomonas]MBB4086005.1 hypothetical protein [Sphingomonas carotinifaciens]SDE74038.1 hypothetical protein SAMN05216557_101359 [Sphingomonas carotinifaciens]